MPVRQKEIFSNQQVLNFYHRRNKMSFCNKNTPVIYNFRKNNDILSFKMWKEQETDSWTTVKQYGPDP